MTKNRKPIFGRVENGVTELNEIGMIIKQSWQWLKEQYDYVDLDEFIIMPNHLHGIIILHDDGCVSRNTSTVPAPKHKSLGRLIGAFKTVSTKQINLLQKTPGRKIWQRDFHDQIIRGDEDLD
ncbi:MAG: transposase, partial [Candidatus Marinimicrobia bacterium]|nr:transposase [Candidatus Neomarinimicrobiota bacterium]